MEKLVLGSLCLILVSFCAAPVGATMIQESLGNTSPGFNDGETPPVLDIINAISGQPAPFDQSYGNDPLGTVLTGSWTFNSYGAILETIVQATITVAIQGHESASPGSQLASFLLDGMSLTTEMNDLFENHGGGQDEYNVYTLTIPNTLYSELADGSATFYIELQGPVEKVSIVDGSTVTNDGNGGFLIYSTLDISTEAAGNGDIPEPATMALLATGAAGLIAKRRRVV